MFDFLKNLISPIKNLLAVPAAISGITTGTQLLQLVDPNLVTDKMNAMILGESSLETVMLVMLVMLVMKK